MGVILRLRTMSRTDVFRRFNHHLIFGQVLLAAVFAASCATTQTSDQYEFSWVATEDMSKRFTYASFAYGSAASLDERTQSPGGAQDAPQRSSGQPGVGRISFGEMREDLEDYMAVEQYCTDGYFIYNETFDGRRYLLHGECQESRKSE